MGGRMGVERSSLRSTWIEPNQAVELSRWREKDERAPPPPPIKRSGRTVTALARANSTNERIASLGRPTLALALARRLAVSRSRSAFQADLTTAEKCALNAGDLAGMLLLCTAKGDGAGMARVATAAEAAGKTNVAFVANLLLSQACGLFPTDGRTPL